MNEAEKVRRELLFVEYGLYALSAFFIIGTILRIVYSQGE